MCGIVGLHGPQDDSWIDRMNAIQRHRGPDDTGVYRDREAGLALAMQRLAIIDASGGHQPMATPDGRFVLVYNGEIYNAPELRRDLERRGDRFSSDHSDTELLLNLLVTEGAAALVRLNGMFAFALYDRQQGSIFCARDRLGIKPLYYTDQGGRFGFASELKSLLAVPVLGRDIDRQSLFHYLSLMYVPGEETIISGINRLPAGSMLTYRLSDRKILVERWWKPEFRSDRRCDAKEWPGRIEKALKKAVGRWSLSDVPIACSLSGGLDSSGIVGALACQGTKVKTFSLGFTGEGEDSWNELPLARAVAQKWGTDHQEIVLDPKTLLRDLPQMVWHLDEPYGGGLPSWLVFKTMATDVKVGLTGTGGDELFGNYGKWRYLERRWSMALAFGSAGMVDRHKFSREFFDRFYYFADNEKREVLKDDMNAMDTSELLYRHYADATGDPRDRVAIADMVTQLPEEFLMMTDRFSMAHSLEARTPFLDNELVELALTIPSELRTNRRDLKGLLRKAVSPMLPEALLRAPKRGFVIPLALWLRNQLRPLCEQFLTRQHLTKQELFDAHFYDRFVRPHLNGDADHTNRIWSVLMFQLWYSTFIESGGSQPMEFELQSVA